LLGFFEFTFMRVRNDLPQKKLARLMWNYAHENGDVVRRIFSGETGAGRSLVYEDSLSEADRSEILTYDTASGLIREAKKIAVGLCYCRHIKQHNGNQCKYPMNVCTSLNQGADFVIRKGFMREISKEEALDIFEGTKQKGLVYVADNVKRLKQTGESVMDAAGVQNGVKSISYRSSQRTEKKRPMSMRRSAWVAGFVHLSVNNQPSPCRGEGSESSPPNSRWRSSL
jgi:hypothetical protein